MRVHLCGVRGSTPATGSAFARYGGDTSCVAIARDGEYPTLLLDAGTGLAGVDALLDGRPFRGTILLGHLHWDHTHGLPFFRSGDRPDARMRVLLPAQGRPAEDLLLGIMSPPHFPITPSGLRGHCSFGSLDEGVHEIEGFTVHAREIPHPGGRAFGYRVDDGGCSLAYLSDHGPAALGEGPDGFGPYHPAALDLARDADVLVHDAQYTATEFPARRTFGHSTIDYALGLAQVAGARHLVLFHHDPSRTDEQLDALAAALAAVTVPASVAYQGQVLDPATVPSDA